MADRMDLAEIHNAGGYGSEFDYDSELEARRAKRNDLAQPKQKAKTKLPSAKEVEVEYNKEESRTHRFHILSLDAYARHRKFINNYMQFYGGQFSQFKRDTSKDKRDIDVIRENHQFLWEDEDEQPDSWEKRLAKKYYDKLFKEYCITDLSRYKENKIALRWRVEKEVVEGKGQFKCGNRQCEEVEGLRSWEVNFGYKEQGEKKNALVKVRLCPDCSYKLNYRSKKREIKKRKSTEQATSSKKRRKEEAAGEADTQVEKESSQEKTTSEEPSTSTQEEEKSDNPWSGPAVIQEEKSREEEFEEYFEDMFL